jgi:hypothetical protein
MVQNREPGTPGPCPWGHSSGPTIVLAMNPPFLRSRVGPGFQFAKGSNPAAMIATRPTETINDRGPILCAFMKERDIRSLAPFSLLHFFTFSLFNPQKQHRPTHKAKAG